MTTTNIVNESPELKKALEWIEHIRRSEYHSQNEKKMLLLTDEIYRLRHLLRQKR